MTVPACAYCYRPSVAVITLRRGPVRWLLRIAAKRRSVCSDHLHRGDRPGGWRA